MKTLSRDEIVTRGLEAAEKAEGSYLSGRRRTRPWIYKTQVRSGRRKIRYKETQAWNIPHLKAKEIMSSARKKEVFSIEVIGRIMKSHLRCRREDY